MATLEGARMPSLRDKQLAQEAEALEAQADLADVEEKRGKGRRIKSKSKN